MSRSSGARGRWGEDRAADHYLRAGFDILDRNWRPSATGQRGELDLVARRDHLIVICEVKARRSAEHGDASLAVDPTKQARVRRLAELWLAEHDADLDRVEVRFDVIAVNDTDLTCYVDAF